MLTLSRVRLLALGLSVSAVAAFSLPRGNDRSSADAPVAPGSLDARYVRVITDGRGGFTGPLQTGDHFGISLAYLGRVSGGHVGLAVGAHITPDGGTGRGAVWILLLDAEGTVASARKISQGHGGLPGTLPANAHFGRSLAFLGDPNGDGFPELAVGVPGLASVWILSLDLSAETVVVGVSKITDVVADPSGGFGISLAAPGDLDGDDIPDLVVGAAVEPSPGEKTGAIYFLFLDAQGGLKGSRRLGGDELSPSIDAFDHFGSSLAVLGDVNADGYVDLAASAAQADGGGVNRGVTHVLLMGEGVVVVGHRQIRADSAEVLEDEVRTFDFFGDGVAGIGDIDHDGVPDLAVGAHGDDDHTPDKEGINFGALWLLPLRADGAAAGESRLADHKISDTRGSFPIDLGHAEEFGASIASLGDLDGDGSTDLAVGAIDSESGPGKVMILFRPAWLWGDANGNGSISAVDALICLSHVVGRDVSAVRPGSEACDVAPELGVVTAADALAILRHAVRRAAAPGSRVGKIP